MLKVAKGSRGTETTFTMPGVEVGSIIEYRYQVRYDRYLTAPDWKLQKEYFVHKEHFVFRPSKQFLPQESKGVGAGDSPLKDPHDNILTDIRFKPVLPPGKTLVTGRDGRLCCRPDGCSPDSARKLCAAADRCRLTAWTSFTPIRPT